MKAITNYPKPFRHTRRWLTLIVTFIAFSGTSQGSDSKEEFHYDSRLMPLARTYLDLQLCANIAYTYDNNHALWDRYISRAETLREKSESLGWTSTDFASAMVIVFEEKEGFDIRESDTRESYNRRHYSGDRCTRAMSINIELMPR